MATTRSRLQLTKDLGRWSGVESPADIETTVGDIVESIEDLVAYVDQAWLDIQNSQGHRWRWMRHRSLDTIVLTPSTATLAMSAIDATCRQVLPLIRHDTYSKRYILLKHPTTGAVSECEYVPYNFWRGWYDRGTRAEQRPARYTRLPDETLQFDPTPDVAYTLQFDWVHDPVEFSADADEPDMPAHFHMLIVWWAIVFLMGFDERSGRYQTADRQYKKMINRLHLEQLVDDNVNEYLSTATLY